MRERTLYSERYDDLYFSIDGGLQESVHVFLSGNRLPERWQKRRRFTIIELGFGSGLNFLVTWNSFREHAPPAARLHYVSVEKHPFRPDDLIGTLSIWPQFAHLVSALVAAYPPLTGGFHRVHFDGGRVTLTLLFGDVLTTIPELEARADAFYLDGFAPSKNPEMWSSAVCAELSRLAAPGATAATYSVAGAVRESLARAGFVVEKRAGFGHKREMLVARFHGREDDGLQSDKRVAVVGAGVSGSHCALALTRCGFAVELIESGSRPATRASANPAGLVRPFLALEEGARSRFTWDAFLYAQRHYSALAHFCAGTLWEETGVLQLARDDAHLGKLRRAFAQMSIPTELASMVDAREGAALCGAAVAGSGIWFAGAGWVCGSEACKAAIHSAGSAVTLRCSTQIRALRHANGLIELVDARGDVISETNAVVLANGHHASALLPNGLIELRPVRGQVTLIPNVEPKLKAPVCQEGYVTPAIGGAHVLGATFDEHDQDEAVRIADHADNLARARRMLPEAFAEIDSGSAQGWVGLRCVSRDRRPVLGRLLPGVYGCLALGSRGFTWAPLAAELIASQIAGEAQPIEHSIATALSVQRFNQARAKISDAGQR